MDKKNDVSALLGQIVLLMGCNNILDLKLIYWKAAVHHIIGDIDPQDYSLEVWVKAATYIFELDATTPFSGSEDVCFYLYDQSIECSKQFFGIKEES